MQDYKELQTLITIFEIAGESVTTFSETDLGFVPENFMREFLTRRYHFPTKKVFHTAGAVQTCSLTCVGSSRINYVKLKL